MSLAFIDAGIHLFALQQLAQTVGELQLSARARLDVRERFKNCGSQNVAADDGKVRRRVRELGLLDEVEDFEKFSARAGNFFPLITP